MSSCVCVCVGVIMILVHFLCKIFCILLVICKHYSSDSDVPVSNSS